MKIAITGHTSGIGKVLFDYFVSYTPMGFSRSNGYNINHVEDRKKIVNQCMDGDVFINNAYSDGTNSQLYLLQEIYRAWAAKDKLIINISSRITDFVLLPSSPERLYQTHKKDQDTFCIGKIRSPQIVNLKLGMVDTPRVSMHNCNKLTDKDIVKIVSFVLENRDSFSITTLTVGK
jgi:hypothetical protein